MRLLRELGEERTARMLADALADAGIDAELKENQDGRYAVWVIDEGQLTQARQLDASWFEEGQSEALARAASRGRAAREIHERAEQRRRLQAEAAAREIEALSRPRPTPLTWGLIALCIAVAMLTQLGERRDMVMALTIADPSAPVHVTVVRLLGHTFEWRALPWREPWRLVTPLLVHFDVLHILLNMLWLRDLGRVIETVHGARYLAIFMLVCGALSNIAQYELGQSAYFAGMSGVVYGLLGLIWMRGRFDPRATYGISRITVQFMLIWLAVGFLGNFGIAKWCHLFGLLIGMAWGSTAASLAGSRHKSR